MALFSFFNLATKNSDLKKISSTYKASFELFAYYGRVWCRVKINILFMSKSLLQWQFVNSSP